MHRIINGEINRKIAQTNASYKATNVCTASNINEINMCIRSINSIESNTY